MNKFYCSIREIARDGEKVGPFGKWKLSSITNMEQMPLSFTYSDGEAYADTGERCVWFRGGASWMDKRQCTAQLTIFADGKPRVKSLIIFEER